MPVTPQTRKRPPRVAMGYKETTNPFVSLDYGFVFSSDIKDWRSKKTADREKRRGTRPKNKRRAIPRLTRKRK